MDWKKHYESRQVSLEEAAQKIESGDRVVAGHACGSPEPILEALVKRAEELENVEIVHMVSMGKSEYCLPQYEKRFRHNSIFAGGGSRKAIAERRADFTTCFFSEIPLLFRNGHLPVDVALVTVSEPDKMGNMSLGISVDYTLEAALRAKTVIAEVSPHMPRTTGNSFLHVSDIDLFVKSDRKMIELPLPRIGEVEKAIGSHVASLIQDGDCLQLGIGAIPDAVLTFLDEKRDLGIHSEMVSDGVMHLVEKGVITGRKKNLHPGKIIITFAMGSQGFYQWLDGNSMVEMHPVDYVNDPFVVAQNDNMVSINSAIAVDLLGQVAADSMGARQFSGVGGQVDFVRGARRSQNGRSIIAMPATAKKGTMSRIVSTLAPGQAVTTSRNDVDYVVTEFGLAHLTGKSIEQRAKALIDISAPEFRDTLWYEFEEIYCEKKSHPAPLPDRASA
ncbi:MAG: 4-hydroxybutyrate CoA-transferase [Desulfobacterales bacterium]|nr:4-hydroxybutyrate CoA-transferase [Desulfobacterales bacterium]